MAAVTPKALIGALNPTCRKALEAALGLCVARTHFTAELEHWLIKFLEMPSIDFAPAVSAFGADPAQVRRELERALNTFKTGNARTPELSPDVFDLTQQAWVLASLGYGAPAVRSSHLLAALLNDRVLGLRIRSTVPELAKISPERIQNELVHLLGAISSEEAAPAAGPLGAAAAPGPSTASTAGQTPALDQYTTDLTNRAKAGEIDPVIGRDPEIRRMIDILIRRRQNNPILTGEAGVGKTAVVEGLALRIAEGDVPPPLKNVVIRVLDLGLLQAGAGVKGEFENRLKSVIDEVKKSPVPIVLFIDEAHTLIGAGGAAGQNDAANLLKPALARGELRTIAATTFAEYKKYFAADAALRRRFQVVRVDEPSEPTAIRMLRGLCGMLEKHHKVRILDEAVIDAVRLSARYLPDRQLPDKAVSLLDTTCARVALSQSATPSPLEDVSREVQLLQTEIQVLEREAIADTGDPERLKDRQDRLAAAMKRQQELQQQLEAERKLVASIREKLSAVEADASDGKPELAADREQLEQLRAELKRIQGETPLVFPVVDGASVAETIAGMTGIPVGKMVRDEITAVLKLKDQLAQRIIGQDQALEAIAQRIRIARAELADPRRPLGVFLLVGPSGVGKTETAIALADLMFGGERGMIIINMSEYKESAKISRLTGTAKGYVGYGEGGVLTNAVKNRPHSLVLLDEVEKADPSVQEIFYQVFDKGVLQNDDGEEVSFKNTIILLTSNVGTETIAKVCADPETCPDSAGLLETLRPDLLKAFKPALLGRMVVVPYYPLSDTILRQVAELQLKRIATRLKEHHKALFEYSPDVLGAIAARCTEVESGARNVDHILTGNVLPQIASLILTRLSAGQPTRRVMLGVNEKSDFTYAAE
jgi:type VI secretion system protein VasG